MLRLEKGDLIDIILPSSPIKRKWKASAKILESWGLKPRIHRQAQETWMFHSQKNKKRSELLNQAFKNKDSKAVWMLRGGYGLQKIMSSFPKRTPDKLFIGYSDGTCLHRFLNGKGQKTLHAPMLSELSSYPKKELKNLKEILFGEKKEVVFKNLRCMNFSFPKKTSFRLPLVGGNLTVLSTSIGCSFFSPLKNPHILFLEDVNEEDYKIDRALHQLLLSGHLRKTKAILFGSFTPLTTPSLVKKVLNSFSETLKIPFVVGLPVGHSKKNSPLPLGSSSLLEFDKKQASLKVKC